MLNRVCTCEEFEALCDGGLQAGHDACLVRVAPQADKVGSIHLPRGFAPELLKVGVVTALTEGDAMPCTNDGDSLPRDTAIVFAIGIELARDLNGCTLWHVRGRDVLAFTLPS